MTGDRGAMTSNSNKGYRLLYWTFVLTLFLPLPPLFFSVMGELVGFTICVIACVILLVQKQLYVNKKFAFVIVSFLSLLIIDVIRDADRLIISDFFEFARPLFLFFPFCLAYSSINARNIDAVINTLMLVLSIVAIWGIVEVFLPQNSSLHSLYKLDGSVYRNKAIASFIAPYSFATAMGIGFVYQYCLAREKLFTNLKYNLFFMIFFLAIILSQSKSAIGGTVVAIVVAECSFRGRVITLPLISVFATFILYTIISAGNFPYVTQFVQAVMNGYETDGINGVLNSSPSISNRVMQFHEAIYYQDALPLIGRGIGKGYLYPESMFSLMLYRYGLVGIAIFLGSIFVLLKNISSLDLQQLSTTERALLRSGSAIAVFFLMVSISSNVIDQFRVSLVYLVFVAISVQSIKIAKNNALNDNKITT